MGTWLLAGLWVAFVLCASTAALARAAAKRGRLWRVLAWGVVGWLLVVTAAQVAPALWLRYGLGVAHAPGPLAVAVAAAHLAGLVAGVRAVRRGALPGTPGSWTSSAVLALALVALVAQQLELRVRLLAADLRFEAGRSAWLLLEPVPSPEDDAWRVYRRIEEAWYSDDATAELLTALQEDRAALNSGEELDFQEAERRERMKRLAPDLALLRAATRLPGCDFGARHASLSDADATSWGEGVSAVFVVADALYVEACARLAADDAEGALEDVLALFRLERQAVASPVMIDLLFATMMADRTLWLSERLLAQSDLDQDQIQALSSALRVDLRSAAGRALEMEQAWVGSALSLVANGGTLEEGSDLTLSRVESALYLIFLFEGELRGYRTSMGEARALVEADLQTLVAESELDDTTLRDRYASRGLVAMMAMGQYARQLLEVRRVDARLDLAREALSEFDRDPAAARARGSWTDSDPAWGDEPPEFRVSPRD